MIQIFGTTKNFDVKTAQRWFSERRIAVQFVDLKEKEMSRGEFDSVLESLARQTGSRADAIEELTDKKSKDYSSIAYLDDSDKLKAEAASSLRVLKSLSTTSNGKCLARKSS